MRKQTGRPPADPLLISRALALVSAGMPVTDAAKYVGISRATLYRKKNAPADTGAESQAEQTAAKAPTTVPAATTVTNEVRN